MVLRCLLVAIVCTGCLICWQALTVHYSYGGNWTALYCTGSVRVVPAELASEHIYRFAGPGYDGQFYHYVAHDPWLRRGISAAIDNRRLRGRRILTPGLAYVLAFGQDRYVDTAYLAVIWISIFLGSYWLARLAVSYSLPAWIGLMFAIVPGVLISADRLVVDGVLAACCVAFVLYAGEGSRWKLYTVLAAGMLARETGLLLIAACAIWMAGKRRIRDALLFSTAVIPAICWFWYVARHAPALSYDHLVPAFLLPLVRRIFHPAAYPFGGAVRTAAVVLDLAALLGFAIAAGWIVWRRRWTPAVIAGLMFVLLSMMISDADVWDDPFGYSRIYTPLLLFGALEGMATRSTAPWAAMLAIVPRIVFQLGPQLLNVLRGITR